LLTEVDQQLARLCRIEAQSQVEDIQRAEEKPQRRADCDHIRGAIVLEEVVSKHFDDFFGGVGVLAVSEGER